MALSGHTLFKLTAYLLLLISIQVQARVPDDSLRFDDRPLKEHLGLPDWFTLSFLNLNESLKEAINDGKKGLIIYFGRKDCAYCKTMLQVNWGDPAIEKYTRRHFNVIAIDVTGARTVTDFKGKNWRENEYSAHRKTNFTPTLVFYNEKGQQVLKLPGYRPKYQFRAALEYVADAHYNREPFRNYMARAEASMGFGSEELNEADFFTLPPYNLDRSTPLPDKQQSRPLAVFFEHPRCHACDVLYGDTLNNAQVIRQLQKIEVVQLNTRLDTPVITPDGRRITSKQWADELDLTFAPSVIFFDAGGKEILRIESVVRLYRLNNILRYIIGQKYQHYPTFLSWLQAYRQNTEKAQ
ncbi:thioredoxin SoxW [hydrothermal vent metagenome]|uniref:Thioredoxin SoxW n=1 Tax=hydrothermal vent metagenome TaxID=652676 RepID=A0A3B0XSW6_9ZZZZ